LASRFIVLESFLKLEQENATANTRQALNALIARELELTNLAVSWSVWDDTWFFMQDRNEDFIRSINAEATALSNRNLFSFSTREGEIFYAFGYNTLLGQIIAPPRDLPTLVKSEPVQALAQQTVFDFSGALVDNVTGIALIDGRPMLLAVTPILPSSVTATFRQETRGVVIFGRYLDQSIIEELIETTQLELNLVMLEQSDIPADLLQDLLTQENPQAIALRPLDEETMLGYGLVRDIYGQPLMVMKVNLPRSIYQEGLQTVTFFSVSLLAMGSLLGLVALLLLEAQVISPITRLAKEVATIETQGDLSLRVSKAGKHEIGRLVRAVNGFLDSVQTSQTTLKAQETRLQEQNATLNQINQDLTRARRKAEEANRLKDEFLASMSHELRTPLNAIIGYSQLMMRGTGGQLSEKHQQNVERILRNGEHLLNLINDVLDLARIEAQRFTLFPKATDIRDLLDSIRSQTQTLADQKGLSYSVEVHPALPTTIIIDPDRLRQIVFNLVSNAFKFTEKGGVTLKAGREGKHHWCLTVQDTGIGIPAHAQEYIFDRFRQADGSTTRVHGGTGLGLAIVQNLCTLMGGYVRVESEVGVGSCFILTLPIDGHTAASNAFTPSPHEEENAHHVTE
jgi:signal transduction histidine kinase